VVIFAVANQKGGTAKTTTALTLGHRLALDGLRVLLVDTDVQGHIAKALGLDKAPGIRQLVERAQFGDTPLLIVHPRPGLDVIPSDKTTEPAKRTLVSMNFRERVLAEALGELAGNYDVAVIDCAPSVDVLHVAALVAADWLVVPSKLDYLAVDGVNEVLTSVLEIKKRSKGPELLGILPTFFDRQTNETVIQLQSLVRTFGGLVLPPIPVDTKLREAPAFGQTIWEYAPTTRSVVGVANGDGRYYGGYVQFIDHVREVL
jgi:chromosome partitioning protein